MYENLQEWFNNNQPAETLIYKDGLTRQVLFVRDTIPSILARSYEELIGIKDQLKVISTHTSKSVLLPVYQLKWNDYTFIMRYNFHDWKISVTMPYNKKLSVNFMDLFNNDQKISYIYCEGFKKEYVYDSYSKSGTKFTCEILDEYRLYTFFWIIKYFVLHN